MNKEEPNNTSDNPTFEEKKSTIEATSKVSESQENQTSEEEQKELHEHFRVTADPNQSPLRIDKFLMLRMDKKSRSKIQNAAKAGCLLVNDKSVKANYKVRPNDVIVLVLPRPLTEYKVEPENIPLDIRYEDDDVIILQKEPNMVVHPGFGNYTGTLVHALTYHIQQLPVNQRSIDAHTRPGLVHRIDKDTSGLLVIAKTEYAMTHLAKQFFDHSVVRKYVALVWGNIEQDEGTITGNVGRHQRFRKLMTVYPDGEYGKHAVTHYKVLQRLGYVTLVECQLETGRTHQIRVHFKSIGHPLFNDKSYGGDSIVKGTVYTKYRQFIDNCFKLLPRHALHAKVLGFVHPTTKEQMHFESDMPEDIQSVIDKWIRYMS